MSLNRPDSWLRFTRQVRENGWQPFAAGVRWRWQRRSLDRSPVFWAQFGMVSRLVGRVVPMKAPPVVVLSLPRSGSSWVGHTLGLASDAAYLREPLEQLFNDQGGRGLHEFERDEAPPIYQRAAALTFSGVPAFPRRLRIVHSPEQWSLADRRHRRIVVKVVNPFAFPWLVHTYQPRVIYLVRHPGALALSYRDLGWWSGDPDVWSKMGRSYHDAHQAVLQASRACATVRVVQYEALCADPVARFRELFEFAGLTWDDRVADVVETQTAGGDETDPYSLARDSRAQIDKWRRRIQPHELAELQAGFWHSPLPWYQAARDWIVAAQASDSEEP